MTFSAQVIRTSRMQARISQPLNMESCLAFGTFLWDRPWLELCWMTKNNVYSDSKHDLGKAPVLLFSRIPSNGSRKAVINTAMRCQSES